jgi:hypothetical protein
VAIGTPRVARAQPVVIVHQLTAIPGALDIRDLDRDFALTNRLRTEGRTTSRYGKLEYLYCLAELVVIS